MESGFKINCGAESGLKINYRKFRAGYIFGINYGDIRKIIFKVILEINYREAIEI